MNLRYFLPRLFRHFLPEPLTRFLLLHGWIIKPGLESSAPANAVERYRQVLDGYGRSLAGKRVLVFGYGRRFDIAVELLRQGAAHVVLCDRYAHPDDRHNRMVLPTASAFLQDVEDRIQPRPEWITLFQGDIEQAARERLFAPVDLVLSSSVFEHLPGTTIDSICAALADLTIAGGLHIHFIDLRDHFFKYPFEMLTFKESTWRRWLNPTSNLNRWRLPAYQQAFQQHFRQVAVTILERDPASYERVRELIQPEFILEDLDLQDVTQIRLDAFT